MSNENMISLVSTSCTGYYSSMKSVCNMPQNSSMYIASQHSITATRYLKNQLKGQKGYLAHSFRAFSPCSFGSIVLVLWWGYILWRGACGGEKLLILKQLGRRKRERKGTRTEILLWRTHCNDLHPLTSPTF